VEQRGRQARGWHEHFAGEPRVNCEGIPRLPAWAIRWILEDPRKVPYLVFWRNDSGGIADVVRVEINPNCPWPELQGLEVATSRPDGGCFLHGARRPLPRGGGRDFLLVCTDCHRPRRYLYAWTNWKGHVRPVRWPCRRCAGLRYASEGEALTHRSRSLWGRLLGDWREERPGPWNPYVMTLSNAAAELGRSLKIVGGLSETQGHPKRKLENPERKKQ
jgi:hypothetical protein